jgi:tetratricopeptide (TPR) repeat protein
MRDFEAFYTEMHEEDIAPHVQELEPLVKLEPQAGRTAVEIETLFDYMTGLVMLTRHEEASTVFTALRPMIDDYRETHPDDPEGLEFFFEWSLLALRLTPESRSAFVSLPLYVELFETFDTGPLQLRYRGVQARAQLVRHYDFWMRKGGNPDQLSEEDRQFIQDAIDGYDALSEAALDEVMEREDHVTAIRLLRNAAQFYLMQKRPNDAIAALKEALEYIPHTPKYHITDTADLQMQMGQIFLAFEKYEVAKRYFMQALETYEASGEDYEMLAAQAEGWVDEAQRKMNAGKK